MDTRRGRSINMSAIGVHGEAQVGGVNLFPIMPPVSGSPGEFVAASCMFMTRRCGHRARGPAGGAGGGIRDLSRRFVAFSSSLGAEMMEWLSPTTLSQQSFNESTCD